MRTSLRRTAVATAATVLSGLSVVPLSATPALAAVTPAEVQFYAADLDGSQDGYTGLYLRLTPNGTPKTVVAESAYTDVSDLSVSRDGSRVAYVVNYYDTGFTLVTQRLQVADASGRVVRTVDQVSYASFRDSQPALSPDGNTVVWRRKSASTGTGVLYSAPVGSGGATAIGGNVGNPVYLDASTLLVESVAGPWYTIPATGGTTQPVTGLTDNDWQPAVSADGTTLAWSRFTGTGTTFTFDIHVGTITLTSGALTVGADTMVASGLDNEHPSFSRDGSTVSFIKYDETALTLKLYTVPATGGTATVDTTIPGDVWDAAYGSTDDGVAPGAPTAKPFGLYGTVAGISWTPATDADLSGVIVRRYQAGTLKSKVYVPAPLTSYLDKGLTVGTTYDYVLTSVDRSGNESTAATRSLTAVLAKPFAYSPTSRKSTQPPFWVVFSGGTAPSSVLWTVQYRTNGGAWTSWVNGAAGIARTFGSAASTGVAQTTSTPGSTYVFKVTAVDGFGNRTGSAIGSAAVVPFDQTKAAFNGGATLSVSSAWLGSYRLLKTAGNYAAVYLTGNQLTVVGTKCRSCGAFNLYDNGKLIKVVDTYAYTTATRTVLFTVSYSSTAGHSYKLVVRGTAGRPAVILDGFGMRR